MEMALFTYGSLMFPQVWHRVVKGRYVSQAAVVEGYARYAVRDATYPGMVAQAVTQVEGVVYFDVNERDLAVLDAFEGEAYQRVGVLARLQDGVVVPAESYLFLDRSQLSNKTWEPTAFEMQRFLHTYCYGNTSP